MSNLHKSYNFLQRKKFNKIIANALAVLSLSGCMVNLSFVNAMKKIDDLSNSEIKKKSPGIESISIDEYIGKALSDNTLFFTFKDSDNSYVVFTQESTQQPFIVITNIRDYSIWYEKMESLYNSQEEHNRKINYVRETNVLHVSKNNIELTYNLNKYTHEYRYVTNKAIHQNDNEWQKRVIGYNGYRKLSII